MTAARLRRPEILAAPAMRLWLGAE